MTKDHRALIEQMIKKNIRVKNEFYVRVVFTKNAKRVQVVMLFCYLPNLGGGGAHKALSAQNPLKYLSSLGEI